MEDELKTYTNKTFRMLQGKRGHKTDIHVTC